VYQKTCWLFADSMVGRLKCSWVQVISFLDEQPPVERKERPRYWTGSQDRLILLAFFDDDRNSPRPPKVTAFVQLPTAALIYRTPRYGGCGLLTGCVALS
jgi:hypothetical protein